MTTCRCPICGTKNAGKSRNGKFHRDCGMYRDENGSSIDTGRDRKMERRLSRTRANQKFQKMVRDGFWDDEEWEAV